MKKHDKKKPHGSKLPSKDYLDLLEETASLECEVEELKEKLIELGVTVIQQRGVINYLENLLGAEDDTD